MSELQSNLAHLLRQVELNPSSAHASVNLANAFCDMGRLDEALSLFSRSAQMDTTCAQAYIGAARVFIAKDHLGEALSVLRQSLQVNKNAEGELELMAQILSHFAPNEYHLELECDLLQCFEKAKIDYQILAGLTANQLLHKYSADKNSISVLVDKIIDDRLWIYLLSKTINVNAEMELLLIAIRAYLLQFILAKKYFSLQTKHFVAAVALQCFANEYVWIVNDHEKYLMDDLQKAITESLVAEEKIAAMLLSALYFSIKNITGADQLKEVMLSMKGCIADLYTQSITEANEEDVLRNEIISIAPEINRISQKVREQYEENPYPRWRALPENSPLGIKKLLRALPNINASFLGAEPLQILVAGCGTGFEPISLAVMDSDAQITAVDLSRASLAYGLRMAKVSSASNIEFLQGDILQLHKLNRKFDLINSTGVLHHMLEPAEGWSSLCYCLKPAGVMRISLYSEYARRRIVTAQQHIKALGVSTSVDDIKNFRHKIITRDVAAPLAELATSDDIYSLSGCRDLLFHVQEHRFTFLHIASLLKELGLQLLKIELPNAEVVRQFNRMFTQAGSFIDLEKWDRFEQAYPDTFVAMYQFWCQKM